MIILAHFRPLYSVPVRCTLYVYTCTTNLFLSSSLVLGAWWLKKDFKPSISYPIVAVLTILHPGMKAHVARGDMRMAGRPADATKHRLHIDTTQQTDVRPAILYSWRAAARLGMPSRTSANRANIDRSMSHTRDEDTMTCQFARWFPTGFFCSLGYVTSRARNSASTRLQAKLT